MGTEAVWASSKASDRELIASTGVNMLTCMLHLVRRSYSPGSLLGGVAVIACRGLSLLGVWRKVSTKLTKRT